MKANTAICFISLGLAAGLLLARRTSARLSGLSTFLLVLVVGISAATLCEYLFGINLGIDELLFADLDGRGGNFPPGRLAPITAICFLLMCAGLVAARVLRRPLPRTAQVLGLVTLVISFQSFAGYMVGITNIFGSAYYTQMALHTTASFLVISIGFLLSLPRKGIFEAVVSDTPGARMARQMLLAVVLVPMIVRWLAKLGFDHGLYDSDFTVLIQVMGSVVLMALIVINASATLLKSDRELERLLESERDARLKAEDASIAKTNFLANMSHEIRTPLGAVLGFSELLANSRGAVRDKQNLSDAIRRNGKQLLHLIDDILDVSRIEAGHLKLSVERFVVSEIYADVENAALLHAREKRVHVHFEELRGVPNTIDSDPHRVKQIFCNLVLNAVKFTPSGGHVKVRAEYIGGPGARLRFIVEDSGIGISPEEASLLFRPFAQVDSSATRAFGGTGLGLALSRRLARALGGDVQLVTSAKGVGSTFVAEIADSLFETTPRGDCVPVSAPRLGALSHARILLVEDSKDNQALIARFLKNSGAVVEIANDGIEGIDKAMHGTFDVVLMDLQMPRMDGYEATRRLRTFGYKTPILALTAHALSGDREKCINGGFSDHLAKPVEKGLLIDAIQRFRSA